MKKYATLLVFSCVLIMACNRKTNDSNNVTMEKDIIANKIDNAIFIEKIDSISKKVVVFASPWGLLKIKSFMEIYENPKMYKDNALHILSSTHNDEQLKRIAIYSMQKLDLDSYISFTQESFLLFKNNLLSEQCLRSIITSPDLENNFIIVKNYKNKEVKELLNQIKNCEKTSSEFRKSISRVQSWIYYRKHR